MTGSSKTEARQSAVSDALPHNRTRGRNNGINVSRAFTKGVAPGEVLNETDYSKRKSAITNADGSAVFEMSDVSVPTGWSQLATDIIVSKYFRKAGVPTTGHEVSAAQVVQRIASAIRQAGEKFGGYFASAESAQNFQDELEYILINQLGAFNSPCWFNAGLKESYGLEGEAAGNWFWDPKTGKPMETVDSYTHPQISACFIMSIKDDLMDIGAAVQREMRLFKYGSGTGTNFSTIRGEGEPLSNGGTSSGLMSFLEVFDKAAAATKSGGTTRRAAKMVCLDVDHPEIVQFVEWKAKEEDKARILIKAGYPSDFNGEAYRTVSGQNSNNSIRVTDEFMAAVTANAKWDLKWRKSGKVARSIESRDLMTKIVKSAWRCADPGLQFDTTINKWHTCPGTGKINASNPCSEYMFLDDTSCNLASINLVKFLRKDGSFDVELYKHAIEIFILAQEIIVDYASYPTKEIAQNSHGFRPLGLGYANLGTLLMLMGIPYDSPAGTDTCGALTAILTGWSYAMSAAIAASKGPFPGFAHNREPMLHVMKQHRGAMDTIGENCLTTLMVAAQDAWDKAVELGEQHGYRNAQATVLAPTGTIGLLMDCDTTGIEPDFALVKFKKLAGGGSFKIVNQAVPEALRRLDYTEAQIKDIVSYAQGEASLDINYAPINRSSLAKKGLSNTEINSAEFALKGAFELKHVFSPTTIGEDAFKRLKVDPKTPNFLLAIGYTTEDVERSNEIICGRMTIEGAPLLKAEHLPIFDCANRCGKTGTRFIAPMGHIRMMAAAQPFISGAISKTVNVPNETTADEIEKLYFESWKAGLKAIAIYRDGSKSTQVLTSAGESDKPAPKPPADLKDKLFEAKKATPEAKPGRRKMPYKRPANVFEGRVGGQNIFFTAGEHDDGQLAEVFIQMQKAGAAQRAMLDVFAQAVSLGLQHGVPLEKYVDKFTFTRFEPQGVVVGHPYIKNATSPIDFIFRCLGYEYLGRTDFLQVQPPEDSVTKDSAGVDVVPVALAGTNGTQKHDDSHGHNALSAHASAQMGDAPHCTICGNVTIRNGTCYRCLNCGESLGCS